MVENRAGLGRIWDITGRRVDFTKNLPLAWGIEIDVPIDEIQRERLSRKNGIVLPDRINLLKYLDLAPQESIFPDYRNMGKDDEWEYTNLDYLVSGGRQSAYAEKRRRKATEDLFFRVFGSNSPEKNLFNGLINKMPGNTILAVEGHSWNTPWEIGEHRSHDPQRSKERKLQKTGNDVPVWKILKSYNNPRVIAGIIIIACYCGYRKVKNLDIPLAYPIGEVYGDESGDGLLPVVVVPPRNLI